MKLLLVFSLLFCWLQDALSADRYRYSMSCPPVRYYFNPEWACQITISTKHNTTDVTIATIDNQTDITLQQGEIHTEEVDPDYITDEGIEEKGILVTATAPLYLILQYDDALNPPRHIDSTQVTLPVADSGTTSYYLVSFLGVPGSCDYSYNAFYSISSVNNETDILIYKEGSLINSFTLGPFESYTYRTQDDTENITGIRVISSEPVSVLSGNLCHKAPESSAGVGVVHIQPDVGHQFVAPLLGNAASTGYSVIVIATEDNTQVNIDDEIYQLNDGDSVEQSLPGRDDISLIVSDKDCVAYIASFGLNGVYGHGTTSIISTQDFYTEACFVTPSWEYPHFLSIVLDGEAPYDDIILDGNSLGNQPWSSRDGFSYVWFSITDGAHELVSNEGRHLAAYVYGHTGSRWGGYVQTVYQDKETEPESTPSPVTTDAPESSLPGYEVSVNGTGRTPDGSDVTPFCAATYLQTLTHKIRAISIDVNEAIINEDLCEESEDMQVESGSSTMSPQADVITMQINFKMSVGLDSNNQQIDSCALEVAEYVSNHGNWERPILPEDGNCLELVFTPEKFDHIGNFWKCQDQSIENSPDLSADNILFYGMDIYDILETEDDSDLTQGCVNQYSDAWDDETAAVIGRINQALADGLCGEADDDELVASVDGYVSSFLSFGSQSLALSQFLILPGDTTFGTFLQCSFSIAEFLLDRQNWGSPFLPTQPGCPALLHDGDSLTLETEGWECT